MSDPKALQAQTAEKKAGPAFRYCPQCSHSLEESRSLLNSYSIAEQTVYYCFCHRCLWSGDIIPD